MAMVNGNRDIVTLLLEASVKVDAQADDYDIRMRKRAKSQETDGETERDRERLVEIKQITKRVVNRYKIEPQEENSGLSVVDGYEPLFEALVLHRYDLHNDFNFLPRDEYLFHFLFTGCGAAEATRLRDTEALGNRSVDEIFSLVGRIYELVLAEIAEEASKSSLPGFLEFLWARQDGQGRPPLHVAAQTEQNAFFLSGKALTLTRPQLSVCDETLKKTILTRDGAGRTPVHRAVALGDRHETLWKLLHLDNDRAFLRNFVECAAVLCPKSDDIDPPHQKMEMLWIDEVLTGHLAEVAKKYPLSEFHSGRRSIAAKAFQDCLKEREFDADKRSLWKSGGGIEYSIDLGCLSQVNGFNGSIWSGCAPIHSAILHNLVDVVSQITWVFKEKQKPLHTNFYVDQIVTKTQAWTRSNRMITRLDVEDMAIIRGTVEDAKKMLDCFIGLEGFESQPLLVAAGLGRYDLLQLLIDQGHDPVQARYDEQTALHFAVKGTSLDRRTGELRSGIDLYCFASCEQILDCKEKYKRVTRSNSFLENDNIQSNQIIRVRDDKDDIDIPRRDNLERYIMERQGCINLLIQEGCNIFKHDNYGKTPYPISNADPKFLSWWHEKQIKEFATAQSVQNMAANAISVTAALVATASYVGPLQPPVGYTDDNQLHLEITAVKVFIVCDTMSFYLAIAAIIAALVPCLPMPQKSMTKELRHTKWMVSIAAMLLFPSIICVLMAFAASSIAVVQTNQTKWNHGCLTISTTLIGGLICLIVIRIFTIRVIAIIVHEIGTKLFKAS